MVPIKEAISSGAWLHCEFINSSEVFGIKVLSFKNLNLSDVDEPEKIDLKDSDSIIWIMELEIVNLSKEPITPTYGPHQLILIDQDGFKFRFFDDDHLGCFSSFAAKSNMKRLYSKELIPKVKAVGAISFLLPNDDEAIYSISIRDGSIKEV